MRTRHRLAGLAATASLTALALGAGVAEATTTSATSPAGKAPTSLTVATPPTYHRFVGPTIFDVMAYCDDTDGGGWPSVGECIHQLG